MIRTYCDVCGKEVIEPTSNIFVTFNDSNHPLIFPKQIYCCNRCFRKFRKFFAIQKRRARKCLK